MYLFSLEGFAELPKFIKEDFNPCIKENGLSVECIELILYTPEVLIVVLSIIVSIPTLSYRIAKWIVNYMAIRDLHPMFSSGEVKKILQQYVQSHCQTDQPDYYKSNGTYSKERTYNTRKKLYTDFIKSSEYQYALIFGGTGSGKTTFLVKFCIWYNSRIRFIKRYKAIVIRFNSTDLIEKLDDIENKKNKIILLDGFDEDVQASNNITRRLKEIELATSEFRKVILTSRTSFFPSTESIPENTHVLDSNTLTKGLKEYFTIYISPFTKNESKKFIRKKFSLFKSIDIVENYKLREQALQVYEYNEILFKRPLLLAYIDYVLGAGKLDYSFQMYEILLKNWIAREEGLINDPDFKDKIYELSKVLSHNMLVNRKSRKGYYIPNNEISNISRDTGLNVSETDIRTRSLLSRFEENYRFSHKSFFDYFLSEYVFDNSHEMTSLESIRGFELAKNFYIERVLFSLAETEGVSISYGGSQFNNKTGFDRDVLRKLEYIVISSNKSKNDFKYIGELSGLKSLDVSMTSILSLAFLNRLNELRILDISGISSKGLLTFSNLDKLQILYIDFEQYYQLEKYLLNLNLNKLYIISLEKVPDYELRKLKEDILNVEFGVTKTGDNILNALKEKFASRIDILRNEYSFSEEIPDLTISNCEVIVVKKLNTRFFLEYVANMEAL